MLDTTLEIETDDNQTVTVDRPTLHDLTAEDASILTVSHDKLSNGNHFSNPLLLIIVAARCRFSCRDIVAIGMPNSKKIEKHCFPRYFWGFRFLVCQYGCIILQHFVAFCGAFCNTFGFSPLLRDAHPLGGFFCLYKIYKDF